MSVEYAEQQINEEIIGYFKSLNDVIYYCFARGELLPVYRTGSDVDVIICRKDIGTVDKTLLQQSQWSVLQVVKRDYVYSYFIHSKAANQNFQLDFEFDFDWWSFVVLESHKVLMRRDYNYAAGVYFASDADARFMKLTRSALWAGRTPEKYQCIKIELDNKFIETHALVKKAHSAFSLMISGNISSFSKFALMQIRLRLILANIRHFGFRKVMVRFAHFFVCEVSLLGKKYGLVLKLEGQPQKIETIAMKITSQVNLVKSPFKNCLFLHEDVGKIPKRKLMRDAFLLLITDLNLRPDIVIHCCDEGLDYRIEDINGKSATYDAQELIDYLFVERFFLEFR